MHAKDVKILRPYSSQNALLQNDLDTLCAWCCLNGMELNVDKCKLLPFCRKTPLLTTYSTNGSSLSRIFSFVDLGVVFGRKLNFHPHKEHIINKAFNM